MYQCISKRTSASELNRALVSRERLNPAQPNIRLSVIVVTCCSLFFVSSLVQIIFYQKSIRASQWEKEIICLIRIQQGLRQKCRLIGKHSFIFFFLYIYRDFFSLSTQASNLFQSTSILSSDKFLI